ncbi:hypothetical protein HMPREF1051_0997 [Neisseria sicca VK64]|uniref:Uncharacterized protein n=1 Tax=Neisseria sicca VK64 TaxID=1095748 RepID=I2NWK4_NEISI|nr:hypothetical protein HMPREF1051_0997 [Neisseria sicca VK64]
MRISGSVQSILKCRTHKFTLKTASETDAESLPAPLPFDLIPTTSKPDKTNFCKIMDFEI